MLSTVTLRWAYGEARVWPWGQPGRSCWQQPTPVARGQNAPLLVFFMVWGALAMRGAKRQTQEGGAGWPNFDPDFAEEPGLIEPYLEPVPKVGLFWIEPGGMVIALVR